MFLSEKWRSNNNYYLKKQNAWGIFQWCWWRCVFPLRWAAWAPIDGPLGWTCLTSMSTRPVAVVVVVQCLFGAGVLMVVFPSDVVNAIGGNTFSHLCGQIYKQCSCFLVESMFIDDKKDLYLIAIPYFLLQTSEVNWWLFIELIGPLSCFPGGGWKRFWCHGFDGWGSRETYAWARQLLMQSLPSST